MPAVDGRILDHHEETPQLDQPERQSSWVGKLGMVLFFVGAIIFLAAPLVAKNWSAVQEAASFGGSCACGIIARLCQASSHQAELINHLARSRNVR